MQLQKVPEQYRRLLREALRELVEAKGEEALEGSRERARLLLTLDVPNIPRGQDALNEKALRRSAR